MQAISLWQPYASLWCTGTKQHETRHWSTRRRGWTLVHAAKRTIKTGELNDFVSLICMRTFAARPGKAWQKWWDRLPRGALVGAVNIESCDFCDAAFVKRIDNEDFYCGNFAQGRYAWGAREFLEFAQPIPHRGQQGFFDVPDSLLPDHVLDLSRGVLSLGPGDSYASQIA